MANPTGCGLVKLGSKGDCVSFLQASLNTISNYGIAEDGIFGNATLNAVVHYQNSRKLAADGQVGDLTWTQIYNDLTAGVKTPVTKVPTPIPGVPAALGGVNWTTIGIVAAIALAVIFMYTDKGKEY